ncbi:MULTISPECIES: TrbI/VirB10 family protein [unclassified Nostoc]|uniref:TrbI/VirB10 family protein n=1 Tax=unclassified Nostoc TaxID=2593658 RepID=UPI002AD20698|nr:TrbI/VirB10 family protein [Nostoc sp. DedQUE03]MDZ7974554.1 TrbI/VirB10 family protein [Nostoc sp. DedQUE03]MDZ8047041.1 TrbI/VirB10 family protein [Nostoc sp. DedQUE02]
MTRYSTPAQTPPQNGFTLTTDDRQPEVESLDWESRMSRLVGFEEESSTTTQGSEDSATPPESVSQPQEVQTKQPLSSNPFAKLGLVGAATLAIVLLGGVFLSQLMSTNSQKPKNIISQPVRSQPTNESASQQLEAEVDTLKTKLALTEQAQMVKAAQQQLRIAKSTPTVALQEPPVSSRGRQTVIPTPPPTPYVPRTVTVERIVKVPAYQPLPSRQLPRQLPVVRPNTQPIVNIITPPSPPSPLEEWTRLAKLGSYGQVNVTDQPNNIAAAPEPVNNTPQPQQTANPNPEQSPQPETPVVSEAQPQGQKSVPVGTSAKAVLATAVFGETTNKSNGGGDTGEGKNVFVIRLKEPLKSSDGAIALPANTEFLTEVRSLSEQGLLQMNVVKVISQNDGNLTERSLPNNAIIIRGTQGKPLIANKFPNQGSSIASMDAGLFVLGGISKAAELINRSDTELQPLTTQTTVDGNTSSSTTLTTVTKNRRNLAAGVVEGGLNSVVPQIAQRNQQAIAQMSQQTGVWFLPAGTNIEVYVNQATQF